MAELKPCPFCGAFPTTYEKRSRRIVEYSIACPNLSCPCMPTTGDFDTEEKAIEAWNRRCSND